MMIGQTMKQIDETNTVNMAAMLDVEVVKASDETATTKTGSTPPTSDTASSSGSTLNDDTDSSPHQYGELTLAQLARQLEYYFSQANLEKDTYVETLRQLNDGYVPVSILQRFSKVQSLVPMDTVEAIVKATAEHSSLLEVASINTKTGKRVQVTEAGSDTSRSSNANCIVAIGSCSGAPLENSALQSVLSPASCTTPGSPIQNTIIIREVDSKVTEVEVRALFDFEQCPPVLSLYLDVFNCWFVTLDTTCRDDMLYVMMSLRNEYLGDEPVKARLKSQATTVDPSAAPFLPVLTPLLSGVFPPQLGKKSKKKKNRSKNGSNSNKGNAANGSTGKKNGNANQSSSNQTNGNKAAAGNKKAPVKQQPKPNFSSASFPSLSPTTNTAPKMVQVTVGMETASVAKASVSDSPSIATTLSSASSCFVPKQQLSSPGGGYAAALRKSKPTIAFTSAPTSTTKVNTVTKASESSQEEAKNVNIAAPKTAAPAVVKPPTWGGGRSFADVLTL